MSDKLEQLIDFTNWRVHPTRGEYNVYFYGDKAQADYFQSLLEKEDIEFEAHTEPGDTTRYFFAIHRKFDKRVVHLNNLAIGKFRDRFIPNRLLQNLLFAVTVIVLGAAFLGYFVDDPAQPKPQPTPHLQLDSATTEPIKAQTQDSLDAAQ